MKKFLIAFCLLLSFSAPRAEAADSAINWQGIYAGVHIGRVKTSGKFDDVFFGDSVNLKTSSAIGGALAGINFVQGNWVGGFEVDIGFASAKGSDDLFALESRLLGAGNFRARAGYLLDRTLFFAAGGISVANFQQSSFTLARQNYFAYGLTFGGGMETFVAPNWLFRVEYLYARYQPFDQAYSFLGAQVASTVDTHVARAALIYQFGGGNNAAAQTATTGPASWSGFYLGGHAGRLGMSENHASGIPFVFPYNDSVTNRGFWGGGLIGVNTQLLRWVFGIELDFGSGSVSGWDSQDGVTAKLAWDAHIRARIGYAFNNYLVYVAGGAAITQLQQSDFVSPGVWSNGLLTGYTIGAGVDALLGPNFIFRVEYLHSRFETVTVINAASATVFDNNLATNTWRAAIIYKYESSGTGARGAGIPRGTVNWAGLYGGVFAGYQTFQPHLESGFEVDDFRSRDLAGGLLFGVNYQTGRWVFGAEADVGWSKNSIREFSACLCFEVITKPVIETTWRARIGYAFDRYLAFVTAGVAVAQFQQETIDLGTLRRAHTGIALGAGLEAAFTDNLFGRIEYLYTEYGLQNYNYLKFDPILGTMADSSYRTQIWRGAIIYKFNQ